MFDLERDELRKTYQLCRLGFGFIAVAMVLFSLGSVVDLFSVFHRHLVQWVHAMPWFAWIGLPIAWGSLIGAVLLSGTVGSSKLAAAWHAPDPVPGRCRPLVRRPR